MPILVSSFAKNMALSVEAKLFRLSLEPARILNFAHVFYESLSSR